MRISDWSSDVCSSDLDGAQGSYVRAALGLALAAQAEAVPVRFEFILHEAQIHRARSLLADLFVQSDCTHLLFVDADIDFAAADIFAMIAAMMARPDCAILGGAVPRRTINWPQVARAAERRSEEHTSELQSLMRISYAVFCLKNK